MLFGQSCNWLVGLGDLAASLSAVELNVAVRRDVRRDATMGAVCASAASDSALDGNVSDHAFLWVQTLGLGVALQIQQKLANSVG